MGKITKLQVIDAIAEHDTFATKGAAAEVFDILADFISSNVVAGNEVYLGQKLGGFKPFERQNGTVTPKFRPSAPFKAAVAGA